MPIQTVAGIIDAKNAGMVLPHEHILIDLRNQAAPAADFDRKVTIEDVPKLMVDPYSMADNLVIDGFDCQLAELQYLASCGCNLVVDCSLQDIGRDPRQLLKLSEASGVNIVCGCGFYTADTHPDYVTSSSPEQLAEIMVRECLHGIADTGIKPGIIGEIGTSKSILPDERKALIAAAITHKATGLAVQVHIFPWSANGLEAADILLKNGVPPEKIVICHSDVSPVPEYMRAVLKLGVFLEIDNFGKEFKPDINGKSFADGDFVSDSARVLEVAALYREGFGKQLLLTNDICLKCLLKLYGGQGYSHIFENIIPALNSAGVPLDFLQNIICRENPLTLLEI